MKYIKYIAIFVLGFLLGKLFFENKQEQHQKEEIQVVLTGIKNMSKLVVSEGTFSEIYNFSDTKKYFYEVFEFEKKAMVSVNAKVEVGYDLSQLEIQVDSINKAIIINKIPKEEITISPDIKYFDLQESTLNKFTPYQLNKLNKKAVAKIKETAKISSLKKDAKNRLFEELSKIYQLSKIYRWKVVDNTNSDFLKPLSAIKD